MKKLFSIITLAIVVFFAVSATAHNKVVVIPLNSPKQLKNIVTVSAEGGDFTDPIAAVASISDASESNPYLVVLGPGLYTLTQPLVMKQHVSIVGAGENATKLTGSVSSGETATSSLISGANNASLSNLAVENTGGDMNSIAIYNNSAAPDINNVRVRASGGVLTYGIYNESSSPNIFNVSVDVYEGITTGIWNSSSSPAISNVTITVKNGETNQGVYNTGSSPTLTNVTIFVSGPTSTYGWNKGIFNNTSDATIVNSNISVSGNLSSYGNIGIDNYDSSPVVTNVNASASGGTLNFGMVNDGIFSYVSAPVIRHSTIEGTTIGINMTDLESSATISQTSVIGGVTGPGTSSCVNSDNGVDKELDANCTIIP